MAPATWRKLRYGDRLRDELGEMQRRVDAGATDDSFDSVKAQQVVDETVKRHDAAMNPKTNAVSTALTSLGFMFHLGLSPASAMVNLTQTALVAYPVMAAKWGFGKASTALLKASGEAARGKNDITGSLSPEEKAAFDEAALGEWAAAVASSTQVSFSLKHSAAIPPAPHATHYVAATRMMDLIDKERPPSWQNVERQSHTTQAALNRSFASGCFAF